MVNHGRCSNVRPAIDEKTCEEMRQREARICSGCPGPAPAVVDACAAEVVKQAVAVLPGFFVDFTGCEDLLQKFKEAATSHGMKPGDSALDLIYLFSEGMLCLLEEV
jgi:hypothetical protein